MLSLCAHTAGYEWWPPELKHPLQDDSPFSRWTRREECDFYRVVSTFGVEMKRNLLLPDGREPDFDWTRFRTFARLDKKTDESLSRYFLSFVAMCRRVCHLRPGHGEGTYLSFIL